MILFAFGLNAYCQPTIKIYAFEQENLPGTIPSGVTDENGNPIKKAAAKKNYSIFLSFKKNEIVTPVQIFIRGQVFPIQTTEIKKTPVEYLNNMIPAKPEKIILVPKTNNKVVEVKLGDTLMQKRKNAYIKKLLKNNDVVIAYLWKGKKYFTAAKKIKELEPVANE